MTMTPKRHHHHRTNNESKSYSRTLSCSTATTSGESLDLSHQSKSPSRRSKQRSRGTNNSDERRRPSTTIGSSSAGGCSNQSQQQRLSSQQQARSPNNNNDNFKKQVVHACDDKGRCVFHPHIQLRKKSIMGRLGGWKDIRPFCPDCEKQEIFQELIAKEANEIKKMERILDQMEQLNMESLTLKDKDPNGDDGLKVSGDLSSSSRSSKDSMAKGRDPIQVALTEGPRRQLDGRVPRKQQKQLSSKEVALRRRSRRQRTLSPKDRRKTYDGQMRRQRTLSPKDRKSIAQLRNSTGQLRRQRTLSPKDRTSNGESIRQRTLSPKDRNSDGQSRRQRTLSPRKDRNSDGQSRRQRTLSPRKDRNSDGQSRRQRTLSPRKDRNSDGQSRRQRALSPRKDRNSNSDGQLRRQRTLSPRKDRNSDGQSRRQRTLSPRKDRNSNSDGQSRRQRTLSPRKDRNSDGQSRRQRTVSPKDRNSYGQLRRQRTLSPKDRNSDGQSRRQRTLSPRKRRNDNDSTSPPPPSSTENSESDSSDDDSSSSSSSFQRKQRKKRREMWKVMAKFHLSDTDTGGDNESINRPSDDGLSNKSNTASDACNTTSGSIYHHQMCPHHPTVRMRNDRCSRCSAEVRKAKLEAGRVMAKSGDGGATSASGGDDNDSSSDKDDISLGDKDNISNVGGDSEEFGNDNRSKRLMDRTNEEAIVDTNPVTSDEESATDSTAKSSTADVEEGSGGDDDDDDEPNANREVDHHHVELAEEEQLQITEAKQPEELGSKSNSIKAAIKSANVIVEDVYSDSDEDDEDGNVPSTTTTMFPWVQQGSQPKPSDTVKNNEEEGHTEDEIENEEVSVTASVATPKRGAIDKCKSAAIQSSAPTIVIKGPSTTSLSLEIVTNTSDMSEAKTLDLTSASHESSNNTCRRESLNESSTSSAESKTNTGNKVQHQITEVEGEKRQSYSKQRLSRSTTRRDVTNKRRSHSQSAYVESSIPFFAALVENARSRIGQPSRSQSVTRNVVGNTMKGGGKKLWTRPRSRSRSVTQNDGSEHAGKNEAIMISDASRSRSCSWSRSFTRKVGTDTSNKMSNITTGGEKNADENRSRTRKGRGGEKSSLQKTMVSSPEKVTEFLRLRTNQRQPITHPRYKLGDSARDEDMIILPKSLSRSGRERRRRGQDSSKARSSAVEDQDRLNESNFIASVKELQRLDAAFIRRSDGRWTYAIVADINDKGIMFVVDNHGLTKSLTKEETWNRNVRRIKTLTHGRVM